MATIYTIGHGRRSSDDFVSLLRGAAIKRLVDVRAFPASRRNPQFSKDTLAAALQSQQIAYEWQGKALGGFRRGGERSAHSALKHPMFRAYAEHMASEVFIDAVEALARAAGTEPVCIMCAESDPAHCHRSLIGDWLVAHGHRVVHLLGENKNSEHLLNPAVNMEEGVLLYRGAQTKLL